MMPNHGRRAKSENQSSLLQPPADVNVITCYSKLGIESTDRLKRSFTERHITARNMLGLAIRKENVNRPAGRIRYAIGNWTISRRRKVRTACAPIGGVAQGSNEVSEPVWIRIGVIINISDYLSGGGLQSRIAGAAQTTV
jgi:hypothetical protein